MIPDIPRQLRRMSVVRHPGVMAASLALLLALGIGPPAPGGGDRAAIAPVHGAAVALARIPPAFVPSAGQSAAAVRYETRSSAGTVTFTPHLVSFVPRAASGANPMSGSSRRRAIQLRFVGASPEVDIRAADLLPGVMHYYLGNDPTAWRTNLPRYGGLRYIALYPGVDLAFSGAPGLLKGTFIVAPGADPAAIAWRYEGVDGVRLDAPSGDLHILAEAPPGAPPHSPPVLVERAPEAWQVTDGRRETVDVHYALGEDGTVRFVLGPYDRDRPLTVDPTLVYSSYLGGDGRFGDQAWGAAVDDHGQLHVVGGTDSEDFPTADPQQGRNAGAIDVFVTKLGPKGDALVYSTYLGHRGNEYGHGIAVDRQGAAYVTGWTDSPEFPTLAAWRGSNGGAKDAFALKLDRDGRLVYSTFLGGRRDDAGYGAAVDEQGNAYLTGETASSDFPTASPRQPGLRGSKDAFVVKLGPAGSPVYATYLGGGGEDEGRGIVADASGHALVTGATRSTDFPIASALRTALGGVSDAFLTRLSPGGELLAYSTYLGGSGEDFARGIALDGTGGAFVTGGTMSTDLATSGAYQSVLGGGMDAFVARLSPAGDALSFASYLGGRANEQGEAIAVHDKTGAFVTGTTVSDDFPTADPVQTARGGDVDAFVTGLAPAGDALVWSTFLGGRGADGGLGIAVDAVAGAYVTGYTKSTDFPTAGPLQATYGGGSFDGFVAKIGDPDAVLPTPPPPAPPSLADRMVFARRLRASALAAGDGPAQAPEQYEIFRSTRIGGDVTRITISPNQDDIMPAWGPGCDRIVYSRGRDVADVGPTPTRRPTSTPSPAPSNTATASPSATPTPTATERVNPSPPDGGPWEAPRYRRAGTSTGKDGPDQVILEPFDLYMVKEDGTEPVNLTRSGWNEWDPAVSPDGSRIAYTADRFGQLDVFLMNADGSGTPVRLTTNPQNDLEPSWSPEGDRIVYTCEIGRQAEICVLNADGTGSPRQLTDVPHRHDADPAWSPDGSLIAYTVRSFGTTPNSDIWLMDADGSNARAVAVGTADEYDPAWDARGSLYFVSTGQPRGPGTSSALGKADGELRPWQGADGGLLPRQRADLGLLPLQGTEDPWIWSLGDPQAPGPSGPAFNRLVWGEQPAFCMVPPPPPPILPVCDRSLPQEAPINPASGCGSGAAGTGDLGMASAVCAPCCTDSFVEDFADGEVYLHSGEFLTHQVDLEIAGRGFDWQLGRTYRSGLVNWEGPLGYSWALNYDWRLVEVSARNRATFFPTSIAAQVGDVLRLDGSGRSDHYTRQPDGSYQAPVGFYTSLRRQEDGAFTERDRGGNTIEYSQPDGEGVARMLRFSDRNGNTMRFQHDSSGRLVRVLDTYGRPIRYTYDERGYLATVEDFIGRRVRYAYDENGDLVAVTGPAVRGTPHGNDFPEGKTTRYAYAAGHADERFNHNLRTITAPNEAASGGPPRVVLAYDTDPNSPNADRVLSQQVGGTNASGVPAGGTIRYAYAEIAGTGPSGPNAPIAQTTVTDRNGNVTEHQFNGLGNILQVRQRTNRDIRPGEADFYETRFTYNEDGELLGEVMPEGNAIEHSYDGANADRLQQGNRLATTRLPDARRGGDQTFLRTSSTFEPIYNHVRTTTEARGNDPAYVPQNGGAWSPERYATVYSYDYQEGEDYAALAAALGISEAEVRARLAAADIPMGLGDQNSDGITTGIAGNLVLVERPAVSLQPGSNMAGVEGGLRQPIVTQYVHNERGQRVAEVDPENNLTLYEYYPENDPDGDGLDRIPGMSDAPTGYLRAVIRDAGVNDLRRVVLLPAVMKVAPIGGTGAATRRLAESPHPPWGLEEMAASDGATAQSGIHQSIDAAWMLVHLPSDRRRNSGTVEAFANIRNEYRYDAVGNLVLEIDGRGIATEYRVNELNQVVQVVRASDVSRARRNTEEPDWENCLDNGLQECAHGMVAFAYVARIHFDQNGNVVRRDTENRDSETGDDLGPWVTQEFRYDILDRLIELQREVSETEFVVTKYRYDRNGSRVLEISPMANLPEGDPARQPANVASKVFDERGLLYTATRGGLTQQFVQMAVHGDIPELESLHSAPEMATVRRSYDGNRNIVQEQDAEDNSGDGRSESTVYLYDGFDREISSVDAAGNQRFTEYDPAGNVVSTSRYGPVGGPSPTSSAAATLTQPLTRSVLRQPLLSQVTFRHDELGRVYERNDRLFHFRDAGVRYVREPVLRDGPLSLADDGWVTTRYEHDRKGRPIFRVEDDTDTYRNDYDGADRPVGTLDPESNVRRYAYDDANNLIMVTEIELSQRRDVATGRVPDVREMFHTYYVYDALNRQIRVTDNLGQTTRHHYDSRGNRIRESDARHSTDVGDLIADPLGVYRGGGDKNIGQAGINRHGNTVTAQYDGLGRKRTEVRELRISGQGAGILDTTNPANPDGLIVVDYAWDAGSRLIALADDGSLAGDQNRAGPIERDAQGRFDFGDTHRMRGNVTHYVYDSLNRLRQEVFDDRSCIQYTFDADDNLRQLVDQNGSVVVNGFDGVNRLVRRDVQRATSTTPHPGHLPATTQQAGLACFKDSSFAWDVTGTTLQAFEYDGLSRLTRSIDNNEPADPGDDATVTYAYDSMDRLLEEVQNGHAVSGRWAGDNVRIGLVYPTGGPDGNGRELEFRHDRLDRLDTVHDVVAAETLVDYDYLGPGRVLERSYPNGMRMTFLDEERTRAAGYDGLGRVIRQRHTDPAAGEGAVIDVAFAYDRSNNRVVDIRHDEGDARAEYVYDSVSRLVRADHMNAGIDEWRLDGAGNWSSRRGISNELNNMNEYTTFARTAQRHDDNGNLVADGSRRYRYDFANRLRGIRTTDGLDIAYLYDAHGRRIRRTVLRGDDLQVSDSTYDGWREIEQRRSDATYQHVFGGLADELLVTDRLGTDSARHFYHQGLKSDVLALTDASGRVAERVDYDSYGLPSPAMGLPESSFLFTGRPYDPEAHVYDYRSRQYAPEFGRFLQRDDLLVDILPQARYAYAAGNPLSNVDPSGHKTVQATLREDRHEFLDGSTEWAITVFLAGDPKGPAECCALENVSGDVLASFSNSSGKINFGTGTEFSADVKWGGNYAITWSVSGPTVDGTCATFGVKFKLASKSQLAALVGVKDKGKLGYDDVKDYHFDGNITLKLCCDSKDTYYNVTIANGASRTDTWDGGKGIESHSDQGSAFNHDPYDSEAAGQFEKITKIGTLKPEK